MPTMYKSRKKKSGGVFLITIAVNQMSPVYGSSTTKNFTLKKTTASGTTSTVSTTRNSPITINYICDVQNQSITTTDTETYNMTYGNTSYHNGTSSRSAISRTTMTVKTSYYDNATQFEISMKVLAYASYGSAGPKTAFTEYFYIPLEDGYTATKSKKTTTETLKQITDNNVVVASACVPNNTTFSFNVTVTKQ